MFNKSQTVLDKIYEHKQTELELQKRQTSQQEIISRISDSEFAIDKRDFASAIHDENKISLIAEIKKASPSEGIIRADFNVKQIAKEYETAGASVMSILTDKEFFQGDSEYLKIAKQNTNLPVLRKDFIFDEYQIYESKLIGADAILLIVMMLDPKQLNDLYQLAQALRLDVLIETHDEYEAEIAQNIGAEIIGINVRDLRNFKTDLTIFERVSKSIDKDKILVAESGINTRADVDYVRENGADAILVGTSLMRAENIGEKVRELKLDNLYI